MQRRGRAFRLALLLAAAAAAAAAAAGVRAPSPPRFSAPRGRDSLLLDCPACSDGDASRLRGGGGVAPGSEAVYAGAFELSWDGLDEVRLPGGERKGRGARAAWWLLMWRPLHAAPSAGVAAGCPVH